MINIYRKYIHEDKFFNLEQLAIIVVYCKWKNNYKTILDNVFNLKTNHLVFFLLMGKEGPDLIVADKNTQE